MTGFREKYYQPKIHSLHQSKPRFKESYKNLKNRCNMSKALNNLKMNLKLCSRKETINRKYKKKKELK